MPQTASRHRPCTRYGSLSGVRQIYDRKKYFPYRRYLNKFPLALTADVDES